MELLDKKYAEFLAKVKARDESQDKWAQRPDHVFYYNVTKTEYSLELYEFTKKFLEDHKDTLSPQDKNKIFKKYVRLWREADCSLHMTFTEYKDVYPAKTTYGKYWATYNDRVPMLAGFDLEEMDFSGISETHYVFPSVNLKNADFSNCRLAYSDFQDCTMTNIKTAGNNTNLHQCYFKRCNLEGTNLSTVGLSEAYIAQCNLFGTFIDRKKYSSINIRDCSFLPFQSELSTVAPDVSGVSSLVKQSIFKIEQLGFSPADIAEKHDDEEITSDSVLYV